MNSRRGVEMDEKSRKRLGDGVRGYSEGLGLRELPGLWRRDWRRAYAILTREHADDEKPKGRVRRFLVGARNLFFGLSYKLTPSRRLLFAICLILAFLGLDTDQVDVKARDTIEIWTHPGLLVLAVAGLAFLLILELADRVLVRDELEVARQLQRDLLPREAPDLAGYDFAFSYRSANTVGGDYYDFVPLSDGRIALVSADASGHGIASALLMAIANSTLKLAVDIDPSPVTVARMMNRALIETGGPRAFLTLFYAVLDPASGDLEYICAGHPFPLLRRPDGTVEKLGTGSFPVGLRSRISPESSATALDSGSLLLLYTDGVPEALNEDGDAFGFDRLERIFSAGGTPQEVHDRIITELGRFEGDGKLEDDRSLVVIARR
jgi:sigma-B regulation protein RsbU (phosphoserine phosphatase)